MYDAKKDIALELAVEPQRGGEVFELLTQYIKSLPLDQRAPAAIHLSSQLLEFTAFEVAGAVDSTCVGVLIECAAKLCDPELQGSDPATSDTDRRKNVLQ